MQPVMSQVHGRRSLSQPQYTNEYKLHRFTFGPLIQYGTYLSWQASFWSLLT